MGKTALYSIPQFNKKRKKSTGKKKWECQFALIEEMTT
ncbi:hypothetical protein QO000_003758 [Alkalihalobacillus hemicentroti]|uniref:Uncharacterized protein n=1 Tax=Guptibacillus hwajinpoensis TaxID=208199 RepID=A0ABU0K5W6_9BACL|nr:hypothetical protein [Alkalihalobacillus hemicentroti]